jgi:Fe-S-cluster containining protein
MKYRKGLCEGCFAACCTMPVEVRAADLARLGFVLENESAESVKKAAKRLEKSGVLKSFRAATGVGILARTAAGDCVFLDRERRCTVYEKRPDTCRKFPQASSRPGFCPASKILSTTRP